MQNQPTSQQRKGNQQKRKSILGAPPSMNDGILGAVPFQQDGILGAPPSMADGILGAPPPRGDGPASWLSKSVMIYIWLQLY